jgi:hypothetical protein
VESSANKCDFTKPSIYLRDLILIIIKSLLKSFNMSALMEFIEELGSEVNDLEQISNVNNRLSEEKILTRHLVSQVRMLLRIVQLQQEGNVVDAEELIVNYQ